MLTLRNLLFMASCCAFSVGFNILSEDEIRDRIFRMRSMELSRAQSNLQYPKITVLPHPKATLNDEKKSLEAASKSGEKLTNVSSLVIKPSLTESVPKLPEKYLPNVVETEAKSVLISNIVPKIIPESSIKLESKIIKEKKAIKQQEKKNISKKPTFKSHPVNGDVFVKRKSKLLSLDKVKKMPKILEIPVPKNSLVGYTNLAKIPMMEVRRTTIKNNTESKLIKPEITTMNAQNNSVNPPLLGNTINTFSYNFIPQENPTKIDVLDFNKKREFKIDDKNFPKTDINRNFININSLPSSNDKDAVYVDDLQTSESRQRSKIEIKEVNGTLYEYEYIYYYDDDYPNFDYDTDTPSITAVDESSNFVRDDKPTYLPTTASTQVETTLPPRQNFERTRSDQSRSRQRTQVNAVDESVNEVIPNSRGRNRGRALETNALSENSIPNEILDNLNLPNYTRFPPRGQTGTSDGIISQDTFAAQNTLSNTNLEANFGLPEVTTAKEEVPTTDTAAENLYALSRAVDTNMIESTTVNLQNFIDTQAPIDYESLYDYEFALSELDEIGVELTTLNVPTTIATTTKTTTTTTTTRAPTTTEAPTTKALRGRARALSRLRSGINSRRRGSSRTRNEPSTTENAETAAQSISNTPATTTISIPSNQRKINRPSLRSRNNFRGRFNRRNNNKEVSEVTTEKVEVVNRIENELTTTITTPGKSRRGQSRNRVARPRPSFGGRFGKSRTEKSTPSTTIENNIIQDENVISTTPVPQPTKPSQAPSRGRFRRPPSPRRNILGRFNRNRKTTTETPKLSLISEDKFIDTETLNNTTETDKPIQTTTTTTLAPSTNDKRHRFNISDRRKFSRNRFNSRRRNNVITEAATEVTKGVENVEAITEAATEEKSTTAATKLPRHRTRTRFGTRQGKNNNINSRFRGTRTTKSPTTITENEIETDSPQIIENAATVSKHVQTDEDENAPINPTTNNKNFKRSNSKNRRKLPRIFDRAPIGPKPTLQETSESNAIPTETKTADEHSLNHEFEPASEPEPSSLHSDPVEEPSPEPEPVTEAKVETTTLSKRQILAQRRANFLNAG